MERVWVQIPLSTQLLINWKQLMKKLKRGRYSINKYNGGTKMEVKVETDNKEFEIYETEKFRFKIEKVSLDNMREKENFTTRLITKIQKAMKQTIKIVSGQEWEGSYRAIFKEIVGREVE